MLVQKMKSKAFNIRSLTDKDFDSQFPHDIRRLAGRHWAPAAIAKRAAKFLVDRPGAKVLDIGSGIGKFCIIGAAATNGVFTGVEQRKNLCVMAEEVARHYQLNNVTFIHANVTEVDFSNYEAFFFYNSFFENTESNHAIDDSIPLSAKLFEDYQKDVTRKLAKMPKGTRLVTYWGDWVPEGYELVYTNGNDSLRFWEKQ